VHEEYKKAPEVTRQRLCLETIERAFGRADKVIVDQPDGTQQRQEQSNRDWERCVGTR
jgi:membrane protease subunit HflK